MNYRARRPYKILKPSDLPKLHIIASLKKRGGKSWVELDFPNNILPSQQVFTDEELLLMREEDILAILED